MEGDMVVIPLKPESEAFGKLLKWEQSYVDDTLEVMVDSLMRPLQRKYILPLDMLDAIFSNAEALLGLHRRLLGELMVPLPPGGSESQRFNRVFAVYQAYTPYMALYAPYNARVPAAIEQAQEHERHNAAFKKTISDVLGARPMAALLGEPMNHVISYFDRLRTFATDCGKEYLFDSLADSIQRAFNDAPRVGLPATKHLIGLFGLAKRFAENYMVSRYIDLPLKHIQRAGTLHMLRPNGRVMEVEVIIADDYMLIHSHVRVLAQVHLADCIIHTGGDESRWVIITAMLTPKTRYKFLPTPGQDIAEWNAAFCMAALAARTRHIVGAMPRPNAPPPMPSRNPSAYLMLDVPWATRANEALEQVRAAKSKQVKKAGLGKTRKDVMLTATEMIVGEASDRIAYLEGQVAWLTYNAARLSNELHVASERLLMGGPAKRK